MAAFGAMLLLTSPMSRLAAEEPDRKPDPSSGNLSASTPQRKVNADKSIPELDLLEARRQGLVSVQAEGRGDGRMTLSVTNRTRHALRVVLPPGLIAQSATGQMGGMGGMGGGMGGMGGGGMFSIPPEHTAKIPFHSVCLEHGKTDPDATMNYTVIPVTQYSNNPDLGALLSMIAKNTIDSQVAQAAAWNLASNLSWQDLANKHSPEVGFTDQLYFSSQALYQAQQLVVEARGLARERAQKAAENKPQEKKSDTKKSDDHVITGR